jgi:squalene-hopene/tetraprenyl-beta-curcumene cyclase
MTDAGARTVVTRAAVTRAVDIGRRALLDLQDQRGFWPFDQPAEVDSTAEDLLFREFTGQQDATLAAATARWIRSRQYPDGGWPARDAGPADLSVSVLAYCALRLAGDSTDAYHMALAAGWIRDAGGLAAAGVRARIWLAMFGQARWEDLRVPPPECVYLPSSRSARLPGRPGWGKPTVVPLAVLAALRPARRLPFSLAELRIGGASYSPRLPESRAPAAVTRAAALRRCAAWISSAQLPDGSWRADGPGWSLSLIALSLLGHSWQSPALARGMAALGRRAVLAQAADGSLRRVELGAGAVQATAAAVMALADTGLPAEHHACTRAGGWLLAHELDARAGWLAGQREAPGQPDQAAPGPAADTALVLAALRRVRLPAEAGQREAANCSLRWLLELQGRDGGWQPGPHGPVLLPALDRRDGRPASAKLTGQVLAALAVAGQPGSLAIRRAIACLLRLQLPDGAWPDEHGASDLQATCAVLPALVAAGVLGSKPAVLGAAGWLAQQQNANGSWGQDSAAATADALLGLLAAGTPGRSATAAVIDHGAAWLTRAQLVDGTWREPPRGLGAGRGRVDISPLRALGRYLSGPAGSPVPKPRSRLADPRTAAGGPVAEQAVRA